MIFQFLCIAFLQTVLSEYKVIDQSGNLIGTFQYNAKLTKRPTKRDTVTPGSNTIVMEDSHEYYNSKVVANSSAWVELNPNITTLDKSMVHEGLSTKFRYAYNIQLPFTFPFYGLPLETITPTTGGFIFVGELIHSQLTETQYIAPLMAEFDPSLGEDSYVFYYMTDDVVIVQWENVVVHSQADPIGINNKEFTFQVHLYKSGDIVFAYKEVPHHLTTIDTNNHYVRVGIAEAYYEVDTSRHGFAVTYIHEYHSINFDFDLVGNETEIYLSALATCNAAKDCDSCSSQDIGFECVWCPQVNQCGDGVSRYRNNWKKANCETNNISEKDQCPEQSTQILPTAGETGSYEMLLCQGSKTAIMCGGSGAETLEIQQATFSRANYFGSVCDTGSRVMGTCAYEPTAVKQKIDTQCAGKESCFIEASQDFFGDDPCPQHEKTLAVLYKCHSSSDAGVQVLVGFIVIILISLLLATAAWVYYAYRHPTSPSGLWLIKYGRFWKSSVYKADDSGTESGV